MTLTTEFPFNETPHPGAPYIGGVQRVYTLPNGYALSCINGAQKHYYDFAWEIAVLLPDDKGLAYETPLTEDVEVFMTDEEANAFIERAYAWAIDDMEKTKS